jgi:hypothetical protein
MTTRDKASRLIREKRIHFQNRLPDGSLIYWVDGDSGRTRIVTLTADGEAICDCPFLGNDCAHSLAVLDLHQPFPGDEEPGTLVSPNDPIENIPGPRTPAPAPPQDEPPPEVLSPAQDDPDVEIPTQASQTAYRSSDDIGPGSEVVPAAEGQDLRPAPPAATPAIAVPPEELDLATAAITWKTLTEISKTEFVPQGLRGKPAACLAAILAGREIGLGPMESLEHISIIDGSPRRSAALQLKLYRKAGHRLEIIEESDTKVTLKGTRGDTNEELTVSYSLDDAVRADLVTITPEGEVRARSQRGKPMPWETSTPDLLWARAVTRLTRRLAPDAA